MNYWGVDPGLSGAIASLSDDGDLSVMDMPIHVLARAGGGKRRRPDLHALTALIGLRQPVALCMIEDVHSMPRQGVASSFAFGFVAGAIQATLAARWIPYRMVQPAVWKRHFGLTGDKDASRRCASQLLPAHAHFWARAKDDGRAEAALIALYASRLGAAA